MKNIIKTNDDVLSITKYLVEEHKIIQPVKLQKILYFLFLDYLKENKKKLFKDAFEAWVYGPVVPKVFYHIRDNGFNFSEIEDCDFDKGFFISVINPLNDENIKKFVDENIKKYKDKDSIKLVEMSHNTTPWKNARKGLHHKEISNRKLKHTDLEKFVKTWDTL